jgi:pimeloyl-ACP methyl ester carboxylesterase
MNTESGLREGSLRLRDGRTLGYAESGDPDGWPVLGCHGSPSSRLERHVEDVGDYRRWGVRFVVPDRPGFGRSDPQPERRLLDWPADVQELVDHLGIDRFSVLSLSGGAAYALACAYVFGERVRAVGVLGGAPPPDVPWPWPRWVPAALRSVVHRPSLVARLLQPVFAPIAVRPAAPEASGSGSRG